MPTQSYQHLITVIDIHANPSCIKYKLMNSFLQGESCSQKESKSCGLLRQHIPSESHFSFIF